MENRFDFDDVAIKQLVTMFTGRKEAKGGETSLVTGYDDHRKGGKNLCATAAYDFRTIFVDDDRASGFTSLSIKSTRLKVGINHGVVHYTAIDDWG